MSLKYRDSQGAETPVAGLNGTSGELVPSVSVIRSGTYTPSGSVQVQEDLPFSVTFNEPMPDNDYQVIFGSSSNNTASGTVQCAVRSREATGFTGIIRNVGTEAISASSGTFTWFAFKLMTDTTHEADSAHIAQNTANFAPTFSDVVSYAVGDYVTYNNVLYRCTTAHTAGVWVAGHFTQVTVGGTLGDIVPSDASASNKLIAKSDLLGYGSFSSRFSSGKTARIQLNNSNFSGAVIYIIRDGKYGIYAIERFKSEPIAISPWPTPNEVSITWNGFESTSSPGLLVITNNTNKTIVVEFMTGNEAQHSIEIIDS